MSKCKRLYCADYSQFSLLRLWVLIYNLGLARYFCFFHVTETEWEDMKEKKMLAFINCYLNAKRHTERENKLYRLAIENPEKFKKRHCKLHVADFTAPGYYLLVWCCPIPFVRRFLKKAYRIPTRWYHKIFFLGTKHFTAEPI